MDYRVAHEEGDRRGGFFAEVEGKRIGQMIYRRPEPALIIIDQTAVHPSHGGRGVGRLLLQSAVDWARATGTRIATTCPFAGAQFARDPSIGDVRA